MTPPQRDPRDAQVENIVGNLLRMGVIVAAIVVLAGCILYLVQHGGETFDRHAFEGEPDRLRSPRGILENALAWRGRGVIQFGLLLLIATPVLRVAFSVVAFIWERDYLYVLITLFVLAVLLLSLFFGDR